MAQADGDVAVRAGHKPSAMEHPAETAYFLADTDFAFACHGSFRMLRGELYKTLC